MNKSQNIYIITAIAIIIIGGLIFVTTQMNLSTDIQQNEGDPEPLIDINKIRGGGPGKGGIGIDKGIPALSKDNIKFVSVSEADDWIQDNELVLILEHKEEVKVYPLQIMVWHEIANDEISGVPVAVTYCPLCGSGIAYERTIKVENKEVETQFGTSGKLYNSNLIMYDSLTDSYWTQIDGLAVVGKLTGQELKAISIDTVVWRDWKNSEKAENAQVLSQDTGMNRDYGRDPYGSYYEDSFLIFPVENSDDRIHAKTVVFGIEVNGKFKAYQEDDLKENPVIEDNVDGVNIKIERDSSGIVKITNLNTSEEIVKERDFWFAWYAFHSDTGLWMG